MKISLDTIKLILYGITAFILTRQVPLSSLSSLANVSVIVMVMIGVSETLKQSKSVFKELFFLFVWVLMLAAYSMIRENALPLIFRFSLILLLILMSYYVRISVKCLRILLIFLSLQALLLVCFEIYLIFFSSPGEAAAIRSYLGEAKWGDVYSYSGYYYFIQIKGSAMLLFGYMITFAPPLDKSRSRWTYRIIMLLGVICAGNFTFLLVLCLFQLMAYFKFGMLPAKKALNLIIPLTVLLAIATPFLISYTSEVLERKSTVSLGTRYDQINVLMTDMQTDAFSILFGKGMGNVLSVATPFRDYTGNIYFELQSLYFLNQMGFLNFLFFIGINLYLALKYIKKRDLMCIYLCYLIYASSNPYFLDTSHVLVIITLVTINKYIDENRLHTGIV